MEIRNTDASDLPVVLWMFDQAIKLNARHGYKAWTTIDISGLQNDIAQQLQYKILKKGEVTCIFSVQFSDPFIWGERDRGDAIYLHRIVVHPDFRGQRQFETVLAWAEHAARARQLASVRMDTWADNTRIINYYLSFGFEVVGFHTTDNRPELPIQNRNLNVALLEMKVP